MPKVADIRLFVVFRTLRAPRLPQPTVTQRPVLPPLGRSNVVLFLPQPRVVGVQTRAVALYPSPIRADIIVPGVRGGNRGYRCQCYEHRPCRCLHSLSPELQRPQLLGTVALVL